MTPTLGDERMSDVDALVWAVEHEPRHRTTIAALARFDRPLDPMALRHTVERASRAVPRLRQRVTHDPQVGIVAPRWSMDPDFRLAFHLRRIQLSEPTDERLLRVVRDLIVQPFDRARPLWELTAIEGLPHGGSAVLVKAHHCVSDGVGGVEMMAQLFDPEPDLTPNRPPRSAGTGGPATNPAVPRPSSVEDLASTARRCGEALGSAVRMYRPTGPRSSIPTARSASLDLRALSLPVDHLRVAGARVDGTVNDAFVTAVALGTVDHFRNLEVAGALRVSVPINTRSGGDTSGNHWTPGRIDLLIDPGSEPDTVAMQVRHKMRTLRAEPAHRLLAPVAAALRRFPPPVVASLFGAVSGGLDVAASNVAGSPVPLRLCGEKVVELVPFGPLSGCAINVTLMSLAGHAHIGVASDPAAVTEPDRLLRDLEAAITAVVKGS